MGVTDTDSKHHVGRVVRALRRARGLSQLKLAELADLHVNTVYLFERRPQPGTELATLRQLAKALGVSPDAVEMLVQKLDTEGNLPPAYLEGAITPKGLAEAVHTGAATGADAERRWLVESIDMLTPAERERLRRWVAGMLLDRPTDDEAARPPVKRVR